MYLFKTTLLIALFSFQFAIAQQSFRALSFAEKEPSKEKDSINLSSGIYRLPGYTSVDKVSWHDSIYRFPSFQQGRITFSAGFTPEGQILLNHNLYFMRLELIEASGDTVGVVPSKNVKQITIGDRLFILYESASIAHLADADLFHSPFGSECCEPGFIEVIVEGPIGLGVINYIKNENREYWPYKTVPDERGKPALLDRYYSKAQTFYFFDSRMKLRKADKPNIMALMRDFRKDVEQFVVEHQIDFDKKEDIVNVVNFCNDLRTRK